MTETRKAGRDQYDFISEGDSIAILHQLPVGLRSMENPGYGGWGGRFVRADTAAIRWQADKDVVDFNPITNQPDFAWPVSRWLPAFQNDFAARADWALLPYAEANHPPELMVAGALDLTASPGETLELAGSARDPDGDAVTLRWWQYAEAGTSPFSAKLEPMDDGRMRVQLPAAAEAGTTLHFILEGIDDGAPALTRYRRVIVTIQ